MASLDGTGAVDSAQLPLACSTPGSAPLSAPGRSAAALPPSGRGVPAWAVAIAGALGGRSGPALAFLEYVGRWPQAQDFPAAQTLVPFVEDGKLKSKEAGVTVAGPGARCPPAAGRQGSWALPAPSTSRHAWCGWEGYVGSGGGRGFHPHWLCKPRTHTHSAPPPPTLYTGCSGGEEVRSVLLEPEAHWPEPPRLRGPNEGQLSTC